jgi:large subunit ribosomal protein L22
MDIIATTKYARMSPTKVRDLARALKGLAVPVALKMTEFNARKAAVLLGKTLKSAIANAENNQKLSAENLFVKEAVAETGPVMKRHWPRSRGMVSPIKKRFCHIRVTLTDKL